MDCTAGAHGLYNTDPRHGDSEADLALNQSSSAFASATALASTTVAASSGSADDGSGPAAGKPFASSHNFIEMIFASQPPVSLYQEA